MELVESRASGCEEPSNVLKTDNLLSAHAANATMGENSSDRGDVFPSAERRDKFEVPWGAG